MCINADKLYERFKSMITCVIVIPHFKPYHLFLMLLFAAVVTTIILLYVLMLIFCAKL